RGAVCTLRKAEGEHGFVKQVASKIAGERAPRAVGASQSWSKADDKQRRVARSECRNRRIVPGRFLRTPFFAKGDKARAERAIVPRLARWHGAVTRRRIQSRRVRCAVPGSEAFPACDPVARKGPGRSWAVAPPDRGRHRPVGEDHQKSTAAAWKW